jgi:hypothetical protein
VLQVDNQTPFEASILLSANPEGIDTLYAVVKGTFTLGDSLSLADEQVPVALADEYQGDPGNSSIRLPGDISLTKPGTDVLLLGHAYAPNGRETTHMDVSVGVGATWKTARVFGDRYWVATTPGYAISQPEPFEMMPLVWERAFGGTDWVQGELRAEVRNPVGTGFAVDGGERALNGLPLPNLEDPATLISSPKDRPVPAGFAPISAHWEPRRSYAGTYDEAWQSNRAPYLPSDFDARFFQLAPPGLVAPGYLLPGEWIQVHGATAAGELAFQLPPALVEVTYVIGSDSPSLLANLDTVLIEPDESRLILVWRADLPCDKRALQVSHVRALLIKAER